MQHTWEFSTTTLHFLPYQRAVRHYILICIQRRLLTRKFNFPSLRDTLFICFCFLLYLFFFACRLFFFPISPFHLYSFSLSSFALPLVNLSLDVRSASVNSTCERSHVSSWLTRPPSWNTALLYKFMALGERYMMAFKASVQGRNI